MCRENQWLKECKTLFIAEASVPRHFFPKNKINFVLSSNVKMKNENKIRCSYLTGKRRKQLSGMKFILSFLNTFLWNVSFLSVFSCVFFVVMCSICSYLLLVITSFWYLHLRFYTFINLFYLSVSKDRYLIITTAAVLRSVDAWDRNKNLLLKSCVDKGGGKTQLFSFDLKLERERVYTDICIG